MLEWHNIDTKFSENLPVCAVIYTLFFVRKENRLATGLSANQEVHLSDQDCLSMSRSTLNKLCHGEAS
jgi:hypothetical protein